MNNNTRMGVTIVRLLLWRIRKSINVAIFSLKFKSRGNEELRFSPKKSLARQILCAKNYNLALLKSTSVLSGLGRGLLEENVQHYLL